MSSTLGSFQSTKPTSSSTETDRGTKIVKAGQQGIDKNSFLKILTAELSNQDPLNGNQDSTQYVAQLAQFSSLEQMANLNNTITLNSASSLIGNKVKFQDTDSAGNNYIGTVKSVTKDADTITLNVLTTDNGKEVTKQFKYSDIIEVNPDTTTDSSSSATSY